MLGTASATTGEDLALHVLGRFAIFANEHQIAIPNNAERLLGYLAVTSTEQRRDVAAGRLWPWGSQDRAMANLRTAIWQVRSAHPRLLEVRRDTVELGFGVRVDYADVVAETHKLAVSADREHVGLPESVFEAELLPGWDEEWLLLERERHRQARLHALEILSARFAGSGHFAHAIDLAYAAIRIEPLRESANIILISTHAAEGNHSEALRQFRAYAHLLRVETGLSPSLELKQALAGRPCPE